MSAWSPTHVQFTVLRARNLISKGKGGNNDVFVTIQLGKEKYQTSTIRNALNPEWFEECDLPIPHMHTSVEVSVYHRGVLSDDFLGLAHIPVWEHSIAETPRSQWVSLHNKPGAKSGNNKYRGELEVKLTFHCQSRNDVIVPQGLKKRSSSIRNIASVFSDRFKLTRSRSFRENRRDPEGGKPDKARVSGGGGGDSLDGQEMRRGLPHPPYPHHHHHHHSLSMSGGAPVHFSALDVNRTPWGVDPDCTDGLTRSYSMSAAYIKSMSLDRGRGVAYSTAGTTRPAAMSQQQQQQQQQQHYNGLSNNHNNSSSSSNVPFFHAGDFGTGVSQLHSQSLYNLPGERRSCAEIPLHHAPPPPYDVRARSQDDSALMAASRDRHHRTGGGHPHNALLHPTGSTSAISSSGAYFEPVTHGQTGSRDPRSGGIYESIKERTEPENSLSSSSDDPESVPGPKPRMRRSGAGGVTSSTSSKTRRDVPAMGSSSRDYVKDSSSAIFPPPSIPGGQGNGVVVVGGRSSPSVTPFSLISSSASMQSPVGEPYSPRDSGILDDRSSSHGNSLEGSINITTDGNSNINGNGNGGVTGNAAASSGAGLGGGSSALAAVVVAFR
ncbi:uncharacterized protein LOC101859102 [Aplysia californica]|uniref:Uncharacterized protein LOC101859102 n=1 Tax=Aplysia californica TaxID=6500 RepID=A0ABM0JQD8_APLCA|nr:uncharacterized protein LOC101859102 [Aplysia californica]